MRLRRITGVNQGQIPNQTREKLLSVCPSGPLLTASCHSFASRQGSCKLMVELLRLLASWNIYLSILFSSPYIQRPVGGPGNGGCGGLETIQAPTLEIPSRSAIIRHRHFLFYLPHFGTLERNRKGHETKTERGGGWSGRWASIKRLRRRHVSSSDRSGAGYKRLLAGVVPTPPVGWGNWINGCVLFSPSPAHVDNKPAFLHSSGQTLAGD